MTGEIFIRAAACISPQQTFSISELPASIRTFSENRYTALEPDYKVHLNIPSARRMSRLIKMGVCAAMSCLNDAAVPVPDAIIAGTGLGCMEDSEKFLASLIANNEQTLSPTSFIFSTHNTVAAQIALLLQCNNYNFTHTHRGLSFENSIRDALLFLKDDPQSNVLVGAADEVTETSFKILQRLGVIRNSIGGAGAGAGEGTAFFLLRSSTHENNLAKLSAVTTFSNPDNEKEISDRIQDFISKNNIGDETIILTGINGDPAGDEIYFRILDGKFRSHRTAKYKHLCGNYHTSTAFAFWLSARILRAQKIPEYLSVSKSVSGEAERILIFNHYKGREFSLLLLARC